MRITYQMLLLGLALYFTAVKGADWPTAELSYPPGGVLLVGEGRSCNITFDVGGDPFPRDRKWYKDGNLITGTSTMNIDESGGNLQTLKINSVARENEGRYWLRVLNDINLEASRSPLVILKVTFLENQFKQSGQSVKAKEGEFAVLECHPPNHFGAYPRFTWSESGQDITASNNMYVSEYGNLVILQVGFDHQSSSYRCTITIDSLKEGYQTKQGPAVSLTVIAASPSYLPPTIALKPKDLEINAQIKSTFRMECAANGYPSLPTIRWYHNNKRITSSSVIYDVQKRNYIQISVPRSGGSVGGTYRCEASDTSKTETASAELTVYTRPIITTGLPTSEVKKSSGSELVLSCKATSTPVPSFRWYKNAEILSADGAVSVVGGSLQISDLNTLDKGVYQCEAYNTEGDDPALMNSASISTGKITVQERLTFVIRPDDVEVFLGTSATFNCLGKGDPGPVSLTWQFNGGTPPSRHDYTNNLDNQATYKISKVTGSDAGKISCIIQSPDNLYSMDTATAVLTIRQGPQVRANEKNITKKEGQDADLVCLVENMQNSVTWKWIYKGVLITVPDDGSIKIKNGLLQIKAVNAGDEGTYTCQADENGLANSDNIYLTVKTRPRITMNDVIRIGEGDDARLTCEVTGKPTPSVLWKRDGLTVQSNDKYNITSTDDESVLTIRAVNKKTDIGDWTCYAKNAIGSKSANINLIVVGICEIMETPKAETIEYQGSVKIFCTVNNCRTASWIWQKDGQNVNFDDVRYVDYGDNMQIKNMLPSDGGNYTCTVNSNTAVAKIQSFSAVMTVTVHAKIYEFPEGNRVLFINGENVELKCSAHGEYKVESPLVVNWYKNNILLSTTDVENKDPNEKIAYKTKILLIESATASDAGHYQCIANNKYNVQSSRDTSLMLMSFPDRPGQPYDTWVGAGAIEISWSEPPDTGNTPLTSYEIEIETKGSNLFRPFMKGLDPMKVQTVIYFLSSNQEYRFRITALNMVGKGIKSESSNEIRTFEDQNIRTSNLVSFVTLTAISSDTITVAWKEPTRQTSSLKGYKIVYRNEDSLETAKFKEIQDKTLTSTNLTDLDAGAQYSVQIESNTGVTTRLVVSSVKQIYTFNQKPTEPLSCEADRETTSRLQITWEQPANSHGKIKQYVLYYQDKSMGSAEQWTRIVHTDPQTTTYVLTLIDDSLDYRIRVSAVNSAGEGPPFECTTTGKTINLQVYQEWWFYLIMALVGLLIIAAIILCALLLYRRSPKKPQKHMQMPPARKESGWTRFKALFGGSRSHQPLRQQDDFAATNAQIYSPNAPRNYNQMNTFSGGPLGGDSFSPYASPKFGGGGGAGGGPDFGNFMQYNKPQQPEYAPRDNYSYNGAPASKYNTVDSRHGAGGGYDTAPKSPYNDRFDKGSMYNDSGSRYDKNPNDFNTYDSRYKGGDSSSRGYPTYDRNTPSQSYGAPSSGVPFKSSKL